MPNWCLNTIVVSSADLSKFKTWLGDGKALLSKIIPTPEALRYGDICDWRYENWGTKWDVDADIAVCSDTHTEVTFAFDSAWGPPTRAMQTMGELFPGISIRHAYLEEGMCFVGVLTIRDGAVVSDLCHDDPDTDAWKQMAVDEFGWEPQDEDCAERAAAAQPKADDLLSAPRRTVWTVESPDGFTIEHSPEHYPTQEAARAALALWVERYRAQGYYSTARMQRIGFAFIASCCRVSEVDAAEYADEEVIPAL